MQQCALTGALTSTAPLSRFACWPEGSSRVLFYNFVPTRESSNHMLLLDDHQVDMVVDIRPHIALPPNNTQELPAANRAVTPRNRSLEIDKLGWLTGATRQTIRSIRPSLAVMTVTRLMQAASPRRHSPSSRRAPAPASPGCPPSCRRCTHAWRRCCPPGIGRRTTCLGRSGSRSWRWRGRPPLNPCDRPTASPGP